MSAPENPVQGVRVGAVTVTVPLTPPSVNHYKVPVVFRGRGKKAHISFKETDEAKVFKMIFKSCAAGKTVAPPDERTQRRTIYVLTATVYLDAGQRGDGDNFWKCLADAATAAGVIHSDAAVIDWHLYKRRAAGNPRTVLTAESYYA